jgi:hypothetical protein
MVRVRKITNLQLILGADTLQVQAPGLQCHGSEASTGAGRKHTIPAHD